MINTRFAAPVAALLAIAIVPTAIHSYRETRVDDGLRATSIASTLAGTSSTATERKAGWVRRNFDTDDWTERTYQVGGIPVLMFAARSYDLKRLYHHPELAVLRGTQTTPAGVVRAADRPDVPMHLIETERDGRKGIAVYALIYDGRFVENPLLFQLRTSFELLVSGRRAMTLIMTSALAGSPDRVDEAPAARLLLAAIADFERHASVGR